MFDAELPQRVTVPYLYLECLKDASIPPGMADKQAELCDNLTKRSFAAGHWVTEEDPAGVVKAILEWLPTIASA